MDPQRYKGNFKTDAGVKKQGRWCEIKCSMAASLRTVESEADRTINPKKRMVQGTQM